MAERKALMRRQTRIQRENGATLTCDPGPGQDAERPSSYTCWGPETGCCRTVHITRVNALKCIRKAQETADTRRSSHDFSDREPVALYHQGKKG